MTNERIDEDLIPAFYCTSCKSYVAKDCVSKKHDEKRCICIDCDMKIKNMLREPVLMCQECGLSTDDLKRSKKTNKMICTKCQEKEGL